MNIINGQVADKETALQFLDGLEEAVSVTVQSGGIHPKMVIDAADTLSRQLEGPEPLMLLQAMGLGKEQAASMLAEARLFLSRGYLERKLTRELGPEPFAFRAVEPGIREKFQPLGVLTHIAAGNAAGLPAFSVLEGLLAGNVNLVKLPGHDDGLSTAILLRIIEIEPALASYVHVFDLPSTDAVSIGKLLAASDAVAVWGSDFAVSGIRSIAPPNLPIIEWGHRLSFAYVTKAGESEDALSAIARDICTTEQLLCSSPQCVYYGTDSFDDLVAFATRLGKALNSACKRWPAQVLEPGVQAEITMLLALSSVEELIEQKKVLRGDGWSILADGNRELKPSPMYRTVWVKPMPQGEIASVLRKHRRYLQTAGLACAPDERDAVTDALLRAGVCRVMPCGAMASNYAGEPHDGASALRRYIKKVVCRER